MKSWPLAPMSSANAHSADKTGADGCPPIVLLQSSKSSACEAAPLTSAAGRSLDVTRLGHYDSRSSSRVMSLSPASPGTPGGAPAAPGRVLEGDGGAVWPCFLRRARAESVLACWGSRVARMTKHCVGGGRPVERAPFLPPGGHDGAVARRHPIGLSGRPAPVDAPSGSRAPVAPS